MKKIYTIMAIASIAACASAQTRTVHSTLRQQAEQHRMQHEPQQTRSVGPQRASVIVDYLTTQPEGELKSYLRSGGCYYLDYEYNYLVEDIQDGLTIDIVWSYDGQSAWIKEPISQEGSGTWLKTTVVGNKLHMPLYHAVWYDTQYDYGYFLAKADRVDDTYVVDPTAEEMTYTIHDDGSISLDDTDDALSIMALVWSDDLSWTGFGDYESEYTPFAQDVTTIPDNLTRQPWMYSYSDGQNDNSRLVEVAFDQDKIYISNMLIINPDNAIVGTVQGDKILVESDQFLGVSMGFMMYFSLAKVEGPNRISYLPSAELNYNASTGTITAPEGVCFFLNVGPASEGLSYWSTMQHPCFNYYVDEPAIPADPAVVSFEDTFQEYGYNVVSLDVKTTDTEGNLLNTEKLYYTLWVKLGDDPDVFYFYADEYYSFAFDGIDELVEVPYNLYVYGEPGYTEIYPGGEHIYLYETGFDDYGVQSIYYGGGERNVSQVVWLSDNDSSISHVTADKAATAIYRLDGRKADAMQPGINIVVRADGSRQKVVLK